MEKILISACLLGQPVRYDGRSCPFKCSLIDLWQTKGLLVPVCPEMDGGLPVPRPPAEISPGGGPGVWAGTARVTTRQADVTAFFIKGAQAALDKAVACGIKTALLKQKSPSCGSCRIYDSSFSRSLVAGMGVTTALLRQNGIMVFGEDQIDQLLQAIAHKK
ncbi:MAG: DUF523 domain-containing protein [Desulfobacter sp.]|uniref:DUF523 domain-containing protein n=1 Tax=Desulfobacter sp. TaxID=2294 RepID=UPI001B6A4165|nr:DUF523 domain-containing protein [Desulfobacter sp.]MBP8829763.1 DUF523 domain-containing protein [Desulfobacter sp.]